MNKIELKQIIGDIKIVYSFEPHTSTYTLTKIADDLKALDIWCITWKMSFSAAKSAILTYKSQIPPESLALNGSFIPTTPPVRDLGLQYSCRFTVQEQATYQVAKTENIKCWL